MQCFSEIIILSKVQDIGITLYAKISTFICTYILETINLI